MLCVKVPSGLSPVGLLGHPPGSVNAPLIGPVATWIHSDWFQCQSAGPQRCCHTAAARGHLYVGPIHCILGDALTLVGLAADVGGLPRAAETEGLAALGSALVPLM